MSKFEKEQIAFPNDFRRNYISDQLHQKYDHKTNTELIHLNVKVSVAGRIMTRRIMGKSSFMTLRDGGGCIQLYFTIHDMKSQTMYFKVIKTWDIGDLIGVKGVLFKTRTGELSIHCKEMVLLTKSLRSLPDKFHGLRNIETKYRQRYLDLIVNEESMKTFKIRSLIISEIRRFMHQHHFIEVETPMMHHIPGGALARPFVTYHNKLNMNMYLRIAPELYLKKLIIGGFEKIFEINRNFRNESISPYHNPEFTMMEIYEAYVDYNNMIIFVQELFRTLTERILRKSVIEYGDYSLDFEKPFIKMSIKEAIMYYLPDIRTKNIDDILVVFDILKFFKVPSDNQWTLEKLHMVLFEEIVSKKIIQPTCITHYPIEVSPLARCSNDNAKIADRFELFIAGHEIGNGFSELNDPDDQRNRFLKQATEKMINNDIDQDESNMPYDKDYIVALEYGLPPTAGVGIGIDRLVMLLTNKHNIRDVILFPTLRSK
ncbi:lysyl-tRNA synthetase [Candidatus Blochmanniella floridana]|uniref:Lysine--tRNA ligase n=1 Tax=Blochmanniella floridana TaxID=203907 RepID=SYK_BLOFL|nr:RecName: Full=Lysine--tRNA ligase; AltName: Full=Lysyl-tRNA synthetase; Short=LysRS [Candidatus Blochmannia floridanus]CAD83333.1 lysyl-tRNA synthetase [Candidatus Blochmannia floridanus]